MLRIAATPNMLKLSQSEYKNYSLSPIIRKVLVIPETIVVGQIIIFPFNKKFRITRIIFKRIIDPITHFNFLYKFTRTCAREAQLVKYLHAFSYDVINKRKEFLKNKSREHDECDVGSKRRLAFLDLLLQSEIDGKKLSDQEIREEVDVFMFGGHDTTTSAITFTLLNLAKYPKIQQQVYSECLEILGNEKSSSMQDLKKMNFLEKVIKESLRLYPSVRGQKTLKAN